MREHDDRNLKIGQQLDTFVGVGEDAFHAARARGVRNGTRLHAAPQRPHTAEALDRKGEPFTLTQACGADAVGIDRNFFARFRQTFREPTHEHLDAAAIRRKVLGRDDDHGVLLRSFNAPSPSDCLSPGRCAASSIRAIRAKRE